LFKGKLKSYVNGTNLPKASLTMDQLIIRFFITNNDRYVLLVDIKLVFNPKFW